jgi:hypothetical protein
MDGIRSWAHVVSVQALVPPTLDSAVRVLAGVWLTAQGIATGDRPFLAIAWGGLGLFVLATGLLRVCPIYTLVRALRAPSSTPRRP